MLSIDYFSDVLCIWAYGGQVRVNELARRFCDEVDFRYRFIPIFASAKTQIAKNWQDKGGFDGFHKHAMTVAEQWSHVRCDKNLWMDCQPATSTSAHVVLKAVSLLEEQQLVDREVHAELADKTRFEALMWSIRSAFFSEGKNIARFSVLQSLVEAAGIDWQQVYELIDNGEAFAALYRDEALSREYCLQGSPSFVLNEGRQVLYGNVGYRIIEANVMELLNRSDGLDGASWC